MTDTTTEVTAPPLTAQLVALLNVLSAGAGGGYLLVRARSYSGLDFKRLAMPAAPCEFVPAPLLRLYEDGEREITIGAAVRKVRGDDLLRIGAIVLRFDVPAVLDRREGWKPDAEGHGAVARRLGGFPLAPSVVLDAVSEVAAVWVLAEPLVLDDVAGLARARSLYRRLAARLEASTAPVRLSTPSATMGQPKTVTFEADDPAGQWLPLPGSVVRGLGDRRPHGITAPVLEAGRRYTIDQFERACAQEETK